MPICFIFADDLPLLFVPPLHFHITHSSSVFLENHVIAIIPVSTTGYGTELCYNNASCQLLPAGAWTCCPLGSHMGPHPASGSPASSSCRASSLQACKTLHAGSACPSTRWDSTLRCCPWRILPPSRQSRRLACMCMACSWRGRSGTGRLVSLQRAIQR
jgi:hypothetical protein